jgi:hypothetical protein
MVSTTDNANQFEWEEWQMESADGKSAIEVPGRPVSVSAAYTGRVAVAYQTGTSFQRKGTVDPDSRYVNLCTAIYECESTGGSEWILEDVINLKNIELHADLPPMDLSVFNGNSSSNNKVQEHMHKFAQQLHDDVDGNSNDTSNAEKQHLKGNLSTCHEQIMIIIDFIL